jgi:hypothetical protein
VRDFSYESLTADTEELIRHLVGESDKAGSLEDKFKCMHMATGAYSAWLMVVAGRFPAHVSSFDIVRFTRLVGLEIKD